MRPGRGKAQNDVPDSPAATLSAWEAREAAALLSVEGLQIRAGDYLARYRKDLDSERGGVPLELAATLGVLRSGRPGFFWYIPPAAQRRFNVGRKASPALQLWAGLRLLNEAAVRLTQLRGIVRLPEGASGLEYWAAVLRLEGLGQEAFLELCSRAGGALELGRYVRETDPGPAGPLAEGVVIYRVLATATWLRAAAELAHANGAELRAAEGELIESRDARVRKIAKKATLGGWAGAALLLLARAKGLIPG